MKSSTLPKRIFNVVCLTTKEDVDICAFEIAGTFRDYSLDHLINHPFILNNIHIRKLNIFISIISSMKAFLEDLKKVRGQPLFTENCVLWALNNHQKYMEWPKVLFNTLIEPKVLTIQVSTHQELHDIISNENWWNFSNSFTMLDIAVYRHTGKYLFDKKQLFNTCKNIECTPTKNQLNLRKAMTNHPIEENAIIYFAQVIISS